MTPSPLNTPILFIIFNRPDTTEAVFERIRAARPARLFVAADGPRPAKTGERERCEETRAILKRIDWACEVETKFSAVNLGCRVAVSSAIDWFFSRVTEGIILEDDCVPDPTFFPYCSTLLEYYRDDERIMHITGVNDQDGVRRGKAAYYFSTMNHVWGWATWRRAWNRYSVDMPGYPAFLESSAVADALPQRAMRRYWLKRFDLVHQKIWDTWDVQWQYAMMINHGLAATPNENLVSNIGFSLDATHTIDGFSSLANRPVKSIATVTHPEFMIPDRAADWYTFRKYVSPYKVKKLWTLIRRSL
jgi:hypothetical protein